MAISYVVTDIPKQTRTGLIGSIKIREGMELRFGENLENGDLSDFFWYWWGIYVDGKPIWRNSDFFKKKLRRGEVKNTAIENTAAWLNAVAEKIKAKSVNFT